MDPETLAIYGEVRERIGLLHHQPGELLSENALAAEFEISRTRMRRIMWQLESDGLIVISKGTGAVVTAVDIKSLREVYVVRLKLLELLGELKPARIPEDMLANLETILKQSRELRSTYDPDALARLYYAFHREMLNIIRNNVLRKITDQLYHQTSRAWVQLLTELDWETEVDYVCDEIAAVLAALRADDVRAVAQIRREHMSLLLQRFNDYLVSAGTL